MNTLSKTEFSEKYIDLLLPSELLIVRLYQENPTMHDHEVLSVYEALTKHLKARLTNFSLPQHKLTGTSAILYDALIHFFEGHEENFTLQEIQNCVKMLMSSCKKWNERFGSQGYLNYISQFL